jgi:hypothetical protein
MTQISLSDEEIRAKVADFQEQLAYCNKLYKELTAMGLGSDFYIGPKLSYAYLPDRAVFKRTVVTRFE